MSRDQAPAGNGGLGVGDEDVKPGHQRDITRGSLAHNIWSLTWPITISQALFLLPGVYDALWLGRLGPDAQVAAVLTMSVRFVMISVLIALCRASGAVVARYVGAKDQDRANLAVLQAVILMVTAAGSLGLVGLAFARPLLTLAGADAATLPPALRYARIIFAGLIAMEMVPSVGFMINAAGDPSVMLRMTLLSTGALLVMEPLLVGWMGLEGAALALIGSNGLGMVWGLTVLVAGRAPVRLDLRNLRLDLPMMGRILRIALPAVVQHSTPNLAMSLLIRLISPVWCADAGGVDDRAANFRLRPDPQRGSVRRYTGNGGTEHGRGPARTCGSRGHPHRPRSAAGQRLHPGAAGVFRSADHSAVQP